MADDDFELEEPTPEDAAKMDALIKRGLAECKYVPKPPRGYVRGVEVLDDFTAGRRPGKPAIK